MFPCFLLAPPSQKTIATVTAAESNPSASEAQVAAALHKLKTDSDALTKGLFTDATAYPSFDPALWAPSRRDLRALPLRLCCNTAPAFTYSPGMALYHYTHDRSILAEEIRALRHQRHLMLQREYEAAAAANGHGLGHDGDGDHDYLGGLLVDD